MTTTSETEPCGAWVGLHFVEGYVAERAWCPRTSGPCPYPGAEVLTEHENARACAVLPGPFDDAPAGEPT